MLPVAVGHVPLSRVFTQCARCCVARDELGVAALPRRHQIMFMNDAPIETAVIETIGPEPPRPQALPLPKEIGGAPGPEPTRYGDWQHKGRCTDF